LTTKIFYHSIHHKVTLTHTDKIHHNKDCHYNIASNSTVVEIRYQPLAVSSLYITMSKSELEKMLAGELYLSADPELLAMRKNARVMCRLYNNTTEEEADKREKLLELMLGETASGVYIEPPFTCDYGKYIYLGKDVYMNFGCVFLDCCPIRIGELCMLGPNVNLYAAAHPVDPAQRLAGPEEFGKPITIGKNVWIGGNTTVCPGVAIGDNTTIGAGSVVTKDIPANVVAAGNPCRVIRLLDPPADGAVAASGDETSS
jgi:maltose O-acetyltransferase